MRYRGKFLIVLDIISAFVTLYAAYIIRFGDWFFHRVHLTLPGYLRAVVVLLSVLVISTAMDLYNREVRLNLVGLAARIAVSTNLTFLLLSALMFLGSSSTVGRRYLAYYLLGFGLLQLLVHSSFRFVEKRFDLLPRVMILGTGPLALRLGGIVTELDHMFSFVGYFPVQQEPVSVPASQLLRDSGRMLLQSARGRVDKIVVALSDGVPGELFQELLACKLRNILVLDAPSFFERSTGGMLIEHISPEWFIFSRGFSRSAVWRVFKRGCDIVIALLALPFLLLLLPLIALLIRLDSPGPVFYRQTRVGLQEEPFTIFKLRTMREDAEAVSGAVWADHDDPRVTRLGRFLRRSRFDELPQIYNVLRGDMSLVGPRPERPEFVAKLAEVIPYYSERHLVRPGVTGWAQIRYPYGASVADAVEKLRYDLYYLKHNSPALDLEIILRTVKVVLNLWGGR